MRQLLWGMLLLILPLAVATETYVDQEIILLENGDARIAGSTNLDILSSLHPQDERIEGTTSELTDKEGRYWLFSYAPGNVSAALVKVTLPKGAVINYIKSPLGVTISTQNDAMTFTFSGEGDSSIIIQYSLHPVERIAPAWTFFLAAALLLTGAFFVRFYRKHRVSRLDAIRPTLNETQLKIIDALLEKGGEASQTALLYLTQIPKASLSRNIELLAQKEIVQKFFNGTSNHIRLHPRMGQFHAVP